MYKFAAVSDKTLGPPTNQETFFNIITEPNFKQK